MTTSTVAEVAGTYFEAWQAGDFERVRSVLADEVTFDGPLGQAANAEECIAGLKRMSQIMTGIVIRKTFVDGPDVLTWFDLHTRPGRLVAGGELAARGERQDHLDPGHLRPQAPESARQPVAPGTTEDGMRE